MVKKTPVSSFGSKVLQKLNTHKGGDLLPDGRGRVGSCFIPKSLVDDFLRKDLVRVSGHQRLVLNEPGKKLLRRLLHLQNQAKNPCSPFPPGAFQAQHSNFKIELTEAKGKSLRMVKNLGNEPLSWLMKRKDKSGKPFLNPDHLEAGEKLSRDFEYAGTLPRTTGFYDGVPINGKSKRGWRAVTPTERQLAAKGRVDAALKYVGPGLSDILVRVCCFNEGLEQAERELSWPSRSGKLVLKIALDRLADHYNP